MVVLRKGVAFDPQKMRERLKQKLAPYKGPKEFIVVDSIPRTSAGKVLKREIRQWILSKR
jgi:long-chain acyl-CoA synthetase